MCQQQYTNSKSVFILSFTLAILIHNDCMKGTFTIEQKKKMKICTNNGPTIIRNNCKKVKWHFNGESFVFKYFDGECLS